MEAEGEAEGHKKCSRCRQRPRAEGMEHCLSCLGHVVEKRVKKALAKVRRNYFKLAIVCQDKNSLGCVVAAYMAKKLLLPGVTVEVVSQQRLRVKALVSNNELKDAAIVLPKCADDVSAEFVETFISNRDKTIGHYKPQHLITKHAINLFESVTEKELMLYAGIKSLKYAKARDNSLRQRLRHKLKHRLQGLQTKYPGTIEALVQTSLKLKGLLSKRV